MLYFKKNLIFIMCNILGDIEGCPLGNIQFGITIFILQRKVLWIIIKYREVSGQKLILNFIYISVP